MELGAKKLFKLSQDLHLTLPQGPTLPSPRWSPTCMAATLVRANARTLLLRGGYLLRDTCSSIPHHTFIVIVFCKSILSLEIEYQF